MVSKSRGRIRDSLLNPLKWIKRSRSSSSAAREGPSTTSQTDGTSRLKVLQRPSTSRLPSISPSFSPSIQSQCSPHPTIAIPEPQTLPDAPKSPPCPSSDLWSQAFRKANVTTQKWLKEKGPDLHYSGGLQGQTQIEEMISLMKSKVVPKDVDEPLTIEIANRKIIVREYIADAIAFVTMVGDAAIVFAPPQASAPWAVAKAVMKVCHFFPSLSKDALMRSDDSLGQVHPAGSISSIQIQFIYLDTIYLSTSRSVIQNRLFTTIQSLPG